MICQSGTPAAAAAGGDSRTENWSSRDDSQTGQTELEQTGQTHWAVSRARPRFNPVLSQQSNPLQSSRPARLSRLPRSPLHPSQTHKYCFHSRTASGIATRHCSYSQTTKLIPRNTNQPRRLEQRSASRHPCDHGRRLNQRISLLHTLHTLPARRSVRKSSRSTSPASHMYQN